MMNQTSAENNWIWFESFWSVLRKVELVEIWQVTSFTLVSTFNPPCKCTVSGCCLVIRQRNRGAFQVMTVLVLKRFECRQDKKTAQNTNKNTNSCQSWSKNSLKIWSLKRLGSDDQEWPEWPWLVTIICVLLLLLRYTFRYCIIPSPSLVSTFYWRQVYSWYQSRHYTYTLGPHHPISIGSIWCGLDVLPMKCPPTFPLRDDSRKS